MDNDIIFIYIKCGKKDMGKRNLWLKRTLLDIIGRTVEKNVKGNS